MQKMTPDEVKEFLATGTRTGKLATVRTDGRPHTVPIWFTLDGEDIVFMTMKSSVKGKNMLSSGRAALCVDEEEPPYAFVSIEANVIIEELSPAELLPWATSIGGRYMGEELAEQFGKRNAEEGEVLVRLRPTNVFAIKEIAS